MLVLWTRNEFLNNKGFGVLAIFNSPRSVFEDNTADGNSFTGFHIAAAETRLTGNTANENGLHGIGLIGSANSVVTGNTADANGRIGIYLQTAKFSMVTGNTATGNKQQGFRLQVLSVL